MPLTQAKCTNCGAVLKIDSKNDAALCEFCGTPFIVEKAIQNFSSHFNISHASIVLDGIPQREFIIRSGILEKYNGNDLDIVIPNDVNRIGEGVFSKMNIRSVVIPTSVISIDSYAFCDCGNLVSLTLPEKLCEIGNAAFARCGISTLRVPSNVRSIGPGAFVGCRNLASVVIENGVRSIGELAFKNCCALSSVIIPDSIIDSIMGIGIEAFWGCNSLVNVQLPEGLSESIISAGFFDSHWYKLRQKKKEMEDYRKSGRCQYCGGYFSGLFTKKCTLCKKPKDY